MESGMERPSYVKWKDIEVEELSPLIGRQFVVGKDVMVARVLRHVKQQAEMAAHHE